MPLRLAAITMPPATYYWRRDERSLPSQYSIFIDGKELICYLVKKSEAAEVDLFTWIRRETNMYVHAVGVAARHGETSYPKKVKVINAPMYHKGHVRSAKRLAARCG